MRYQGSCHCAHIAFEVEGDLHSVLECNCSICQRLGALRWFVKRAQIKFLTPETHLSSYQFGKKSLHHYFCAKCGCAPLAAALYQGVEMASINVRCLENVDLATLKIKQVDGRSLPVSG